MTIQPLIRPSAQSADNVQRFLRWLSLTVTTLVSSGLLTLALSPWVRVGINATDSLPGLFYLVLKNQIPKSRGDLVAFYPPENRFYRNGMVFIKQAMGLPEDTVTRKGRDFYINDSYLATAKTHSGTGVPLPPGPTGIIPRGRYFVWTPHPDSYDSRYEDIGWISQDRFVGRAVRLF